MIYIYEDGTVEATNSYTSAIKHTRRGTLNIKNVTLKTNSTQNYLEYNTCNYRAYNR